MNKIYLLFISILISVFANAQWALINSNVANGTAKQSQIVISNDGTVYVSYQHFVGGLYELHVKKYDGSNWTEITNGALAQGSYDNSLKISPDGTLYILFVDEEISSGNGTGKASCMKFMGGTSWEYVGERGFSPADINMPYLDFDSQGNPYAGFKDRDEIYNGGTYAVTVMKYNGTIWEVIGERGIIPCWSGCAMQLDNNDVPYIAAAEGANGDDNQLRIFKYDGTNWIEPASGAQSEQQVFGLNIRFNSQNVPHVAFTEFASIGTDDKVTVKMWSGVAWEKLGHPISEGPGYYPCIEFDNQDNLYISYQDYVHGSAPAGVKVWDGNTWIYTGNLSTINNRAEFISLTLDQNQQPWISYSDVFTGYALSVYQYLNPATTYSVHFSIANNLEPTITLDNFAPQIATGGTATFTGVSETPAPGISYTIELQGYETINDNVIVDGDEHIDINLSSTNISETQNNAISIYPNPTNGIINLEFADNKIQTLKILDITGKMIFEKATINKKETIDLSGFGNGVYFIKIQTDKEIFSQKLIIQ